MGLNSLHPHRDGLTGRALEPLPLWQSSDGERAFRGADTVKKQGRAKAQPLFPFG